MFKKNNPGANVNAPACGCGTAPCNFTETVDGCTAGLQGATVTVLQSGSAVATGTTAADGTWCANLAAGSYTVRVAPNNARFATPADRAVTLSGSGPWADTTQLAAATGYVCCLACNLPLKTTLSLTDSNATTTLTWHISSWVGGYSLGQQNVLTSYNSSTFTCTTGPGGVALGYSVSCPSAAGGALVVRNHWLATGDIVCGSTSTCFLVPSVVNTNNFNGISSSSPYAGALNSITAVAQNSLTCSPLNYTGTLGTPAASPTDCPAPSGMPAGTVTITEAP